MNAQMSLSADSLIKKYGPKTVVDSVSLSVDQGEIVGLLGLTVQEKLQLFIQLLAL